MAHINQQIKKAKQELEQMIDLNPQVMLLVSTDGIIMRANRSLLELTSSDNFEAIIGASINDVFSTEHPDLLTALVDNSTGYGSEEAKATLPNGTTRALRFTAVSSGESSELTALIVRDIGSEHEIADQLEKKHKKQAVQETVGALLHNINQPLTVILLKAQLMHLEMEKRALEPSEIRQHLDDITSLTNKIGALLAQVEHPNDYVTEHYMKGAKILDIARSADDRSNDATLPTTVNALVIALNAHSPRTAAHSQRAAALATQLATRMGLSADDIEHARRSALLHDIGKLGISDSILDKPGSLTETERDMIMKHCAMGANILRSFTFLGHEADAALCHHEWHNGEGYPREISGDDIPRCAQIVAVVDAFDAATSFRPYHDTLSRKDAAEQIIAEAGTHYCPDIIEVFQSCWEKLRS